MVATDIKLFLPGLGSWNYSDYNSETANVINVLMKYSYAQSLTGGVGPFSFEAKTGDRHNFNIRRKDGGLLIRIPGGQVVAYIMKTTPKFPYNQTAPFLEPMECEDHADGALHRRRRRSVDFENDFDIPDNLKHLAKSLFSDGLAIASEDDVGREREAMSRDYINDLIKDGEAKKEKLLKFIGTSGY